MFLLQTITHDSWSSMGRVIEVVATFLFAIFIIIGHILILRAIAHSFRRKTEVRYVYVNPENNSEKARQHKRPQPADREVVRFYLSPEAPNFVKQDTRFTPQSVVRLPEKFN
jgi:hypothetical protein